MVEAEKAKPDYPQPLDFFSSLQEIEESLPQLRKDWRFGHLDDAEVLLTKIERSLPKLKEEGSDVSSIEEIL